MVQTESGAKIMALLDAGPTDSPPGIAIANGALLTCLIETLVKQGVLNRYQAHSVVIAAQGQIANLPDSPVYNDAKFVLRSLVKRFPPQ
jgi:hypothetical protein